MVTAPAAIYFIALVMTTGGILLAWRQLQLRYGDQALELLSGLARPMPRFATLLALLTMAALGLPPFGLFSGYIGMLLHPSVQLSWDLLIVSLTWIGASLYLYRMMQRLLWGSHRSDISYRDLRPAESLPLIILLVAVIAVGLLPYGFLNAAQWTGGYRSAMEMTKSWIK